MNDLFYFVKQGNLFNYADDNSVSVNHEELNVVSRLLQAEAEVTVQWFSENAMQTNPAKFQDILLKGNKDGSDFKVSIRGQDINFFKSVTALGICIDENLTFDNHVNNVCLRLAGRLALYNAFLICPAGGRFTLVSSFQNLIIVHWYGSSPVEQALWRCKNSRNVLFVSFAKAQSLIAKPFYPRAVLILFVYLHWKIWQWKSTRF